VDFWRTRQTFERLTIVKDPTNHLFISSASLWEISIKLSLQKIKLPFDFQRFIEETLSLNIEILDIQINHILRVSSLPFHHKDPFDRLIIAQGLIEDLPIISSDSYFSSYKIKLIW